MALAAASAAPAAHAAAPASQAAGITARATCKAKVTIAGKSVCLRVGRSCKTKYESKYLSKGYTCKRDSKGRYRLRRAGMTF